MTEQIVSSKSKRKFCFISHFDENIFYFRRPIFIDLIKSGHEVTVLCPQGRVHEKFADFGVSYRPIRLNRKTYNPFSALLTVFQIYKHIKCLKPDIVQSFTIKPNIFSSIAGKIAKCPLIILTITGLGSVFIKSEHISMRHWIVFQMVKRLYGISIFLSHCTIFQNNDDLKYFNLLFPKMKSKFLLIRGSGVNISLYIPPTAEEKSTARNTIGIRHEPFVFLFVGRLLRDKGLAEFLSAAEILLENSKCNLLFLVVGPHDSNNPSSMRESELNRYQSNPKIKFFGEQNDIKNFYWSSDVFCLPSYREGLPMSSLEALACGLPIITTDAPGCRDTVISHKNGLMVPPRNVQSLVDSFNFFIENKSIVEEWGRNSRDHVVSNFSMTEIVRQYRTLYDRFIN